MCFSRSLPRLAAALGLALVLLFAPPFAAVPQAQGVVGGDYAACLEREYPARVQVSAPNVFGEYLDPDEALNAVWTCSAELGGQYLVPIATRLLGAFALILLIWTGLQFMYSGYMDLGSAISTLLLIGFAYAVLDNYYSPTPRAMPWGNSRGFVFMVADQAITLGDDIIGTADEEFVRRFAAADSAVRARQSQAEAGLAVDPSDEYRSAATDADSSEAGSAGALANYFEALSRRFILTILDWFTSVVLWIIGWFIYAQYLWGFFALGVCALLGPLFVPFMLFSQFDWLFWGWFKALLQSAIYMLMAAAMYVVVSTILLSPIDLVTNMPYPSEPGSMFAGVELMLRMWFEYIPLVVMSFFAAFKVGALAGGLMAGATPAGSGLSTAMRAGAGYLGDAARRWGSGPSSTPVPSSVATARHQAAYADFYRRTGRDIPSQPVSAPGGSSRPRPDPKPLSRH